MEKKIIESVVYPIRTWLIRIILIVGIGYMPFVAFLSGIMDDEFIWGWRRMFSNYLSVNLIIWGSLLVVLLFLLFLFWDFEISVTDKRVFGRTIFNRKVDLPLDSVSAIGTSAFKGISVATSSGKISFLFIKNAEEIRNELNKLIIQRQEEKAKNTQMQTTINQVSNADELKKYKQLLDDGIITQEEFDAKKKQILGL